MSLFSGSSSKVDWVAERLDSIRMSAFRLGQAERAATEARRKASFGMLDSKQQHATKTQLYKRIDAITDSMWLRFVFLAQSTFRRPATITNETAAVSHAHASLIKVSAIALEVRQAVFDLLDLHGKLKLALGGTLTGVQSADFATKTFSQRLYGLVQMQEKLLDLAAQVKIQLAGQKLDATHHTEVRSGDALRDVPAQRKAASAQQLLPLIEMPIILLDERLAQHFSEADRETLFALMPQLRDLRSSLNILYHLHCDDSAVALALADTLGEAFYRLAQHPTLRDTFLAPVTIAFYAARAGVWSTLRADHEVDLTATAQAATKQRTVRETQYADAGRRVDLPTSPLGSPSSAIGSSSFQPIQKPSGTPPASGTPSPLDSPSSPAPELAVVGDSPVIVDGPSPRLSPTIPRLLDTPDLEEVEEIVMPAAVPTLIPVTAASSSPAVADDEWVEATSGGNTFWYSTKTGQSAWTRPAPAVSQAVGASSSLYAPSAVPTPIPSFALALTPAASASSSPTESSSQLATDTSSTTTPSSLPPASPWTVVPTKSCAFSGCEASRFGGKPYCVAHAQQRRSLII